MAKTITELMQNNKAVNPGLSDLGSKTDLVRKAVQSRSGKAAPSTAGGPARSNMQEAIAAGAVAEQGKLQELEARLRASEIAATAQGQERQATLSAKEAQEQTSAMDEEFLRKSELILNNLRRDMASLDMQDRQSMLEASVQLTRLSNQQYVRQLKDKAQREGITSRVAWQQQMARTMTADSMRFFREGLLHERVLFKNSFEFQKMMDDMKLEQALELGRFEGAAASAQMRYEGISTMISGGLKAADRFTALADDNKPQNKPDGKKGG